METPDILIECLRHYEQGTQDNDQRRLRENGWNDVVRAYLGKLPTDWPYLAMVTDPIIRTSILEKTSRLFNGRLRGRLIPREGGDILKAKINNALLDYQWDSANDGGSMIEKWALMDMQTRLYGASFALTYWCVKKDDDDKVIFEGNEMKVLDNRDVFIDYTAPHIRSAKWVQVREWKKIEDLEAENEAAGGKLYRNLDVIRDELNKWRKSQSNGGDRRDNKYEDIVKQLRGLEDRIGEDISFPVLEVVTEYRDNQWITFVPRFKIVIRDIDNPYTHKKIPVVQLRYYPVGDDIYGESEVESVLPISRAINALLCGAIDEINLRMKPPIKVANNETVRMDTIEYGPNALWLVGQSQQNVEQLQTSGEVINNFSAMYSALKSAYQNAMGELSQGTSDIDPFVPDKTATEVRATQKQQLSRDQYNQLYLEQALKDQMMLWVANNAQFLFSEEGKSYVAIRVLGRDMIKELQQAGLDQTRLDSDGLAEVQNLLAEYMDDEFDLGMVEELAKSTKVPMYPVVTNPAGKDLREMGIKPKLSMDKIDNGGFLYITPDDMQGTYDYIPSVASMALNSDETKKEGREKAFNMLLLPSVNQQLQMEGQRVKVKELLVQVLEDNGINNADEFFEQAMPQQPMQGVMEGTPDTAQPLSQDMLSGLPQQSGMIPANNAGF